MVVNKKECKGMKRRQEGDMPVTQDKAQRFTHTKKKKEERKKKMTAKKIMKMDDTATRRQRAQRINPNLATETHQKEIYIKIKPVKGDKTLCMELTRWDEMDARRQEERKKDTLKDALTIHQGDTVRPEGKTSEREKDAMKWRRRHERRKKRKKHGKTRRQDKSRGQ